MAETVTRTASRVVPPAAELRKLFLVDPSCTYLNHGSFGVCPQPVFETYQGFQRELERQPVDCLDRRYSERLDEVRAVLADLADLGRLLDALDTLV